MPKIVSAPKIVSLRAIPKSVRVQIILGAWTSRFVADLFVLFFSGMPRNIIENSVQGCALEVPGCHRLQTFAFGQLERLTFFI